MTGFFTKQETKIDNFSVKKRGFSCYSCGLYKNDINCPNPKMEPFGQFKKGIMNIGSFTSFQDDQLSKPFQGSENYIYHVYNKLGIDIEKDCININAVRCFTYDKETGKSRIPTAKEISCCQLNIFRIIQQYKPKLIVLFGKIALTSVIGSRWKKSLEGIDKWRGFIIPDQELKCWIAPVFLPSFVQQSNRVEVANIFEKDLKNALAILDKEFPVYQEPTINYITDLSVLEQIPNNAMIAFDYETTGLKPYAKSHKIVCCSVATDEDNVYVFTMPNEIEKREPFINLLNNKYIKKFSHNMKFEEPWSWVKLKTRVKSWYHDAMLAAHILDNRTGITNLKFQTYVNFGIIDYSSTVEPYLQAIDEKNANSMNRLLEYFATPEGKKETLKYCAYDSINEYRLAMKQMKEFELLTLPF